MVLGTIGLNGLGHYIQNYTLLHFSQKNQKGSVRSAKRARSVISERSVIYSRSSNNEMSVGDRWSAIIERSANNIGAKLA